MMNYADTEVPSDFDANNISQVLMVKKIYEDKMTRLLHEFLLLTDFDICSLSVKDYQNTNYDEVLSALPVTKRNVRVDIGLEL